MVIQHILRYLTKHPNAKDTMPGILRWWLPKRDVEWQEEEVQQTLDGLVARGWVTQRRTTPARTLYGLNKAKLDEIERFLCEPERETEG